MNRESAPTVTYFAYGSNLLFQRLHARTPSIVRLGTAILPGHRLIFDKPGHDGSGKCGIEPADSEQRVVGVLYRMQRHEKPILDRIEGDGFDYVSRPVEVLADRRRVTAFTYYPTERGCQLPYDWYKALVLAGAQQNDFPPQYLALIAATACRVDPDEQRRQQHLALIDDHPATL